MKTYQFEFSAWGFTQIIMLIWLFWSFYAILEGVDI